MWKAGAKDESDVQAAREVKIKAESVTRHKISTFMTGIRKQNGRP